MAKVSNEDLSKKDFADNNTKVTDTTQNSDVTLNDIASTNEDNSAEQLEQPQTKALQSTHVFILVGLIALSIVVLIYFWMGNDDKKNDDVNNLLFEDKKPTTQKNIPIPSLQRSSANPETEDAVILKPPKEPEKTTVQEPAPPAPPPPPASPKVESPAPVAPTSPLPTQKVTNNKNREDTKIKSSIMLTDGGSNTQSAQKGQAGTTPKIDSNIASGIFTPEVSSASATVVSTVGDMSNTITQGKILDSVLETPINTLYPGPIRAIISRDIYSEKGTNVLIPKGSRIIGTIKGGYKPGETRVAVDWTRIILPNGYDINITSAPGTDKLGMLGLEGIVNRQFMETIGSAALLSIINISAAKVIEDRFNIKPSTTTTTDKTDGTTTKQTSQQSPTQQAAQTEFTNLSNSTKDWLKQNFVPTPYIVIDQGTRIKVFVNQDIRFPKNLNGTNFIK